MVATAQESAASPAVRQRAVRQRDEELLVWPDLVFVEFISAVVFTLVFTLLSVAVNAPLLDRANAGVTPNPSKAPWYFLNLQELLLHMHPALAGVLIPAGLLFGAIPLIPYFDRNTADVGRWFGPAKAVPITIFTSVYSTIVLIALVSFAER